MLLSIDELVDAGKILEIDPAAIANRVLMRGADARAPQNSDVNIPQVRDSGQSGTAVLAHSGRVFFLVPSFFHLSRYGLPILCGSAAPV